MRRETSLIFALLATFGCSSQQASPSPQDGGTVDVADAGQGTDEPMESGPARRAPCSTPGSLCDDFFEPYCGPDGTCGLCFDFGPTYCSTFAPMHPVCGANGFCSGCLTNADCSADATKPVCEIAIGTCVAS